jgi:hypothetical protein
LCVTVGEHRRVGQVAVEHVLQRPANRVEARVVEARLRIRGRKPGRQQQGIALA